MNGIVQRYSQAESLRGGLDADAERLDRDGAPTGAGVGSALDELEVSLAGERSVVRSCGGARVSRRCARLDEVEQDDG